MYIDGSYNRHRGMYSVAALVDVFNLLCSTIINGTSGEMGTK